MTSVFALYEQNYGSTFQVLFKLYWVFNTKECLLILIVTLLLSNVHVYLALEKYITY